MNDPAIYISNQALIVLLAFVGLWRCIDRGWLREISIRGIVARFIDTDDDNAKPSP